MNDIPILYIEIAICISFIFIFINTISLINIKQKLTMLSMSKKRTLDFEKSSDYLIFLINYEIEKASIIDIQKVGMSLDANKRLIRSEELQTIVTHTTASVITNLSESYKNELYYFIPPARLTEFVYDKIQYELLRIVTQHNAKIIKK